MSKFKRTNCGYKIRFNRANCGYLAGLIDGEGTFIINFHERKKSSIVNSKGFWYARMTIHISAKDLLLWCQATFGGRMGLRKGGTHYQMYYWNIVKRKELLTILPQIIPYLKVKRLQAETMLEYLRNCKKLHFVTPEKFTEEFDERMTFRNRMKQLNRPYLFEESNDAICHSSIMGKKKSK